MAERLSVKCLPRECRSATPAGFGAIASGDAKGVMSASIDDLLMLACITILESALPNQGIIEPWIRIREQ